PSLATHIYNIYTAFKKKRLKKKTWPMKVTDPETQYSVLNSNDYFVDGSPPRATSPSNNVGEGQVSEMPLGKRKKKKKSPSAHLGELLESEATGAGWKKSPGPKRQVREQSTECLSGEKKKKKRKSLPQATSRCSGLKTSLDAKHAEKVSKAGKKSKKHRKEKKVLNTEAFPPQDPWLCETGDALHPCSEWAEAGEQAALGHKRKQGRSREHSMKKKKKSHQEGDILPVHSKLSMENGLKKGSKKSVRSEALDYIPIDSPKASGKKGKPKKKVDQPDGEGLAVRRRKKKRKESEVKEDSGQEEEEESDTDLEVVLEKKALQEEIDHESGKTEASEPKKCTGTQFGQWDTAGFEKRRTEHLSPSFSRPPSMSSRSNMDLDKKSSDMLQQNLQQDYDRAMSWKYNHGTGLGFSYEARKVFYIDHNASKSIKLQD
uniref:Small acidic protein-like domain-containing protein n=1 Tax=Peromyscus maniculatus bairdii TaxID=230844 RepID=A0A8C9CT83_PERMB